jgi:hypothetical protein
MRHLLYPQSEDVRFVGQQMLVKESLEEAVVDGCTNEQWLKLV